jgi:hypothetical protein
MRSSSLLLLAGLAAAPLACGDRGGDTTGTQTTSGATDTSTGSTTEVSGTTQPTSSTSVATTTGETIADVTTDPSSGTGDTGTTGTTGATGSTGLETGDTSGSTGSEDTASSDTSSSGDSGGGIGEGESCQDDPDGCKPGLLCCYPCGIPDCENKCIQPDPQTQMCPLFP